MIKCRVLRAFQLALVILCLGSPAMAQQSPTFVTAADGARIAFYPLIKPGAASVPVIVLSGGPGTDSRYMRVGGALDRLAKNRSVIFYDQRGTARSSDSRGDETIDKYVEDIESIRKAIGSPKVDFIGHSFGGYLAMAYTATYPKRVRSLVLVAPAPPKMSDLAQVADTLFPERIEAWRAKRAALGKNNPGSDYEMFQSMEFVDAAALRRFLDAVKDFRYNMEVNNTLRRDMQRRDYTQQVRQFSQPALIINGRFDAIVPPLNSWRLHKELPHSTFMVIEGTGHLPHVEKPGSFLAIVQPFLASLDQKH